MVLGYITLDFAIFVFHFVTKITRLFSISVEPLFRPNRLWWSLLFIKSPLFSSSFQEFPAVLFASGSSIHSFYTPNGSLERFQMRHLAHYGGS